MKNLLFVFGLATMLLLSFKKGPFATSASEPIADDNEIKSINMDTPTVKVKKTSKKGFKGNIEKEAVNNIAFRRVLYTAKHMQLVLMCLKPGEDIGEEIHANTDQFFRFESGNGKCIIDGNEYDVANGDAIIVPAGSKHNIKNTNAKEDLKLYTLYSPPQHKVGVIRATKKEAEKNEEKFDGKTTE